MNRNGCCKTEVGVKANDVTIHRHMLIRKSVRLSYLENIKNYLVTNLVLRKLTSRQFSLRLMMVRAIFDSRIHYEFKNSIRQCWTNSHHQSWVEYAEVPMERPFRYQTTRVFYYGTKTNIFG